MKPLLSLILVGTAFPVIVLAREYSARVTLHVVDDEGRPVSGAQTAASFVREYASKESERVNTVRGFTDAKGLVTFEGKTVEAGISYGAEKEGHYKIWGANYQFTSRGAFRLSPWNPTIEVVLKRIKNPVPMYARRVSGGMSLHNEPYGYDLMAGDWVSPHGKGKIADIIFLSKLKENGDRDFDWTIRLSFSNPGDGIQRFKPDPDFMRLRSPYEAPEEGYLSVWNLHRTRRGPKVREETNFEETAGYFLRVRSELDKNGKVVKALYGKIYGDFFNMVHYLNPDGTRNMEYDPKRNLLMAPNNWELRYYEVGP
jgi:hypothetical protein